MYPQLIPEYSRFVHNIPLTSPYLLPTYPNEFPITPNFLQITTNFFPITPNVTPSYFLVTLNDGPKLNPKYVLRSYSQLAFNYSLLHPYPNSLRTYSGVLRKYLFQPNDSQYTSNDFQLILSLLPTYYSQFISTYSGVSRSCYQLTLEYVLRCCIPTTSP